MIPVRNLAIGAVIKVILTYTLVSIPSIQIKGAAISTVVTYVIAALLNLYSVKKHTNVEIKFVDTILRPVIAGAIMGIVVKLTNMYTIGLIGSKFSTVLSIAVGAVVYGFALLLVGAVTTEDLKLLPKGEKLAKMLKRIGLLRK